MKHDISVLIVDDSEDNRMALSMRLGLAGYDNVTEATDGREALELLRSMPVGLVLLDIMMPGMDGYEVLEEMKADTDLRDVPVIMISALNEVDSVVRCIELGAADYLSKPFNPALLKARLDSCVQRAQFKAQEAAYHQSVEEEKKRADELLAMLLPKQVARILKSNQRLAPVRYDDVSVLFCDVVGFTAYAESHPPETVFTQLEALVGQFEDLVDQRGLMKIKTIGDAFMATGNLLQDLDDPVRETLGCALDMVALAEEFEAPWRVRIGIDHGPVMAGIIGRRNFQFDAWGDTVNTAARLQHFGAPGTVNISGRGWRHVQGRARGRSLGMVDLKGKEPIEAIECQELR
jgi:class 3 adenylate cyclase